MQAVTVRAFADYEGKNPVGYPLAWESLKDGLVQLLRQVDRSRSRRDLTFRVFPVSFETDVTTRLRPTGRSR